MPTTKLSAVNLYQRTYVGNTQHETSHERHIPLQDNVTIMARHFPSTIKLSLIRNSERTVPRMRRKSFEIIRAVFGIVA